MVRNTYAALLVFGLLALALVVGCNKGGGGGGGTGGGNTPLSQVWELRNARGDIARVIVSPFTNSGTFTETSDSPGWWIYDGGGNRQYRLNVGGNIVHAGGADRWTFVGLSGSGGGQQSMGNGEGMTTDGQFPNARNIRGTSTLTTQARGLPAVTGTANWTGTRK